MSETLQEKDSQNKIALSNQQNTENPSQNHKNKPKILK